MIKLSASICEYNPFHNGHAYNLTQAKPTGDAFAVILGGNFTQRGEIAVLDKYTRAIHAIKGGADMVVELPTVYATANAEIFALGGAKIFNEIGATTLCFGAEKDNKQAFLDTANALLSESKSFKKQLKSNLKLGYTFAKARFLALENQPNVDKDLLSFPNNILGLEYVKALLKGKKPFDIYTVKRKGASFNDSNFCGEFSSASGIRNGICLGQDVSTSIPKFVAEDLPKSLPNLDKEILYSILNKGAQGLKNIPDCTEGLQNRILSLAKTSYSVKELLNKVQTKRYTNTRLQRILINSLLGIDNDLIKLAKKTKPYVKVLAIKKDKMHLLSQISNSATLITRISDTKNLNKAQKTLLQKDVFACEIYSLATNTPLNPYEMKIVE